MGLEKQLADLFATPIPASQLLQRFPSSFSPDRFRHRQVPNKLAENPHNEKEKLRGTTAGAIHAPIPDSFAFRR